MLIIVFFVIESQGFTELRRPLTLDEKIGQLFIAPACELGDQDHLDALQRLIQEGRVGGLLLKQGTALGQREFIDRLQKDATIPLLCVQDGEWGVAMRLKDATPFPKNLTLGAIQDYSLLYRLGREIGSQCIYVGAHLNLAPVVDVNTNPLNPIIHMRSFGEDPLQAALCGEMIVRGMQSMKVYACAKHFPGHGDTSVDSHSDLPCVTASRERLQTTELFPFQWLIRAGVKAVMSAHLEVPALENTPATFSKKIITNLLREEMGFNGLILTDALNMKALTNYFSAGEIALKAFKAGHDLLLYGDHIAPNIDQILRQDLPEAFARIKTAVESGEISEEEIDVRVSKIMQAKRAVGLFEKEHYYPEEINTAEALALKKRLYEEAITVVRNENVLPLREGKVALIGCEKFPFFKAILEEVLDIETDLLQCTSAVVAVSEETDLNDLLNVPVTAVVFGSPYLLAKLPLCAGVVVAYENEQEAQEAAAEVLLGRLSSKGRLPVSVKPNYTLGTGLFW